MSGSDSRECQEFEKWMKKYNRHYDSKDEKEWRFNVFQKNLLRVETHNSDPKNKKSRAGLKDFADLTYEEFVSQWTGLETDTDDDVTPVAVVEVPVKSQRRCCGDDDNDDDVLVKRQRRGCNCGEKDTKEPEES